MRGGGVLEDDGSWKWGLGVVDMGLTILKILLKVSVKT